VLTGGDQNGVRRLFTLDGQMMDIHEKSALAYKGKWHADRAALREYTSLIMGGLERLWGSGELKRFNAIILAGGGMMVSNVGQSLADAITRRKGMAWMSEDMANANVNGFGKIIINTN
jgi:hypothetical protein